MIQLTAYPEAIDPTNYSELSQDCDGPQGEPLVAHTPLNATDQIFLLRARGTVKSFLRNELTTGGRALMAYTTRGAASLYLDGANEIVISSFTHWHKAGIDYIFLDNRVCLVSQWAETLQTTTPDRRAAA